MNDGSTDESLNKITSFIEKYPANWRVLTIENSGQTFARNYGIQVSKGEYVSFLDADDLWHPNKLKAQIESFMSDPKIELVFTPYVIFSENQSKGFRVVKNTDPESLVSGWLTMRGFGGLIESTGMVRRKTLLDFGGFPANFSMTAGLDLSLRIVQSRGTALTSSPLVFYRLSEGQFHKNEAVLIKEMELTSKMHSRSSLELSRLSNQHKSYHFWSARRREGKSSFVRSTISTVLSLDYLKLSMLYFLMARNLQALIRGHLQRRFIRESLLPYNLQSPKK